MSSCVFSPHGVLHRFVFYAADRELPEMHQVGLKLTKLTASMAILTKLGAFLAALSSSTTSSVARTLEARTKLERPNGKSARKRFAWRQERHVALVLKDVILIKGGGDACPRFNGHEGTSGTRAPNA